MFMGWIIAYTKMHLVSLGEYLPTLLRSSTMDHLPLLTMQSLVQQCKNYW